MALSAAQKVVKARANLVMAHPFFGSLALRLKTKEDPNMKENGKCDGTTITYNPKMVNEMPLSKVQGMIAHLVMHPAFLHHTRRGHRDKKQWNKACDFAINTILKNANFDLPDGRIENPAYNGMTAEHIYTLLPPEPPAPQNGGGGNDGGGGDGGENNDPGGDEGENNDPGGDGGVEDSPSSQAGGGTQSQQNHEEAEWKVALAQAAHVAKQAGKLPGDLERLLEELLEPVLPWKDILRRFMTERANDDFSWKRGNRRFIAQGLYLPSRESEGSGEIVIVIDTSGSIGQEELDEFGGEIQGIIKEARPTKTTVIYCDAHVNHVDTFKPEDDLQLKLYGGGGTDFRPPFKYVEEHNIEPKCLVYLTDGYGPFPEEHTVPYPTMWVINNDVVVPEWGEHLVMKT